MTIKSFGTSIVAIVLGVIVEIGSSVLIGFVIGFVLGILFANRGVSQTEFASQMTQLNRNFLFVATSLAIGLFTTFLGGFTAASIAKRLKVTHAGIVGAISVLFGLLFAGIFPLWYDLAALFLTAPAAILGGYVAKD